LRVMKGHRVVIEALAQLAGREVRPRVAFVGRGAMEPALREAVARVGLERQVTFAGFVDDGPAAMARSTSRSTCRWSPTGCHAWSSSIWPRDVR
jgi:glycosyltransferase involved in cell wall biosynthesis